MKRSRGQHALGVTKNLAEVRYTNTHVMKLASLRFMLKTWLLTVSVLLQLNAHIDPRESTHRLD